MTPYRFTEMIAAFNRPGEGLFTSTQEENAEILDRLILEAREIMAGKE